MKITLHLDKKCYKSKPKGGTIGTISKRITKEIDTLTPAELSTAVANGQTVLTGIMDGERSISNFVATQVLMLDFDNNDGLLYRTFEDVKADSFVQAHASFMYKTLSHTEESHKFRVVFVLDKPLTTVEAVYGAYEYLLNQLPEADPSCKEPARIFFGGIASEEVNYSNVLETAMLPTAPTMVKKPAKKKTLKETARAVKPEILIGELPTWQLIRDGKKEEVKERLSVYEVTLHSISQCANYFDTLDMRDVLGIYENPFNDIFHEEADPSGSIFKSTESGNYLYKCHSASHPFIGGLIQVVEKLLGVGYVPAVKYLIDVCNVTIAVTEQIQALRDNCELFANLLVSHDLKLKYPAIYGRFNRYKTEIYTILSIFKENLYEDNEGNLRSLTWMSVETLANRINNNVSKVKRILNLLTYTNWIDKLTEEQIPLELLKKLKERQNANGYSRRSNVFELLYLGDDYFHQLNKQCEEMKQVGFTIKGFSREYVARTHGEERANAVYVQDIGKQLSKATDKFATAMHKYILDAIAKDGYAIEKDVLVKLQKRFKSKGYSEVRFKQCISETLEAYGLSRARLNRNLRAQFNVKLPAKAMPVILFKQN